MDNQDNSRKKVQGLCHNETNLTTPKKIGIFHIMTAKEASGTTPPPLEWIVENVLPKKFNSIIAGTTGSKKTYWAIQLGMCIANGEKEFCGNAIKQKQKVLYVDTEIGMDELHRRFLRIQKHLKWQADDDFIMMSKTGKHTDIWDSIHQAIESYRPDLIIIDSLYNSTTVSDFSTAPQISKVTDALTQFKDRYGITVLAVHHFNKGQHEIGLMIERMSGASILQNWVEFLMLMTTTNVDNLNLWTVGKVRGFNHDRTIIGLVWENFWFETKGIIEDFKPYLITEKKLNKWEIIIDGLDDEFNTQEWLKSFWENYPFMSERTGKQWLKECSSTPRLQKIKHGKYRKKFRLIK